MNRKQQLKQFMLTALVALCSITTFAHDFEVDGIYYNITSENTVEVTFNGDDYTVDEYGGICYNYGSYPEGARIPEQVSYQDNTYDVTRIGECAFADCTNVKEVVRNNVADPVVKVVIPYSIEEFGNGAFIRCTSLEYIYLPDLVQRIGYSAFARCTKLKWANLGAHSLGSAVFVDCDALEKVILSDALTQLELNPFACISLKEIDLNGNTQYVLNNGCFYSRDGVLYAVLNQPQVTIPEGIHTMLLGACAHCTTLEEITIPASVTAIHSWAFINCTNLKRIYNLSDIDYIDGCIDVGPDNVAIYTGLPETIKLTVSAAEYATLILPFDAEVPQGIKAYTCDMVRGSTLLLTEADKLEAYTPYIIYGYNVADADGECLVRGELGVMNNTYSFTGAPTKREKQFEVGQLVGTLEDIYAPQGCYVLQSQDGVVGFYRVATDNIMVKANRAYLKAQASGIRAFTFAFADGETVVRPVVATEKDAATYSLSGVRVAKGYKGIVIRDGKKYLSR